MAGQDLHWLTISEASKLLQSRQVSATEILEDTLEWVKKTDPVTRNFAYLAEKEAREEAKRADEEIGRGDYRGPLHGVPYTVKALISVAGAPMAWNSKVYADWSPKKDAEVVRRMRNAGGVLLGKVHTHEFAWGVTTPPTLTNDMPGTCASCGAIVFCAYNESCASGSFFEYSPSVTTTDSVGSRRFTVGGVMLVGRSFSEAWTALFVSARSVAVSD